MAKVRFTQPFRPSMPEAELENPIRIDLATKRVSGFLRMGDPTGAWQRSIAFDFALSELDMTGAGGPLAKLSRGVLLRAIAVGLIPAGVVEASD